MDRTYELERFRKSFLLHSSRYNLYSKDTLVKGSTRTHNQAVKALGKLQDKVASNPLIYSELLLALLMNQDAKVALCAGFTCLAVNLHTDKALERLAFIAQNTPDISMICDLDIRGNITMFRKKTMDAKPRNEVDELAEKMKCLDGGTAYTDEELLNMVLQLHNVDVCGHDGRTPLIHACISKRFELASQLLENGADVNKKDSYQKTALHCAVIAGSEETVSTLATASGRREYTG